MCWSVMCRFLLQCTKCSRQASLVQRCAASRNFVLSEPQAKLKYFFLLLMTMAFISYFCKSFSSRPCTCTWSIYCHVQNASSVCTKLCSWLKMTFSNFVPCTWAILLHIQMSRPGVYKACSAWKKIISASILLHKQQNIAFDSEFKDYLTQNFNLWYYFSPQKNSWVVLLYIDRLIKQLDYRANGCRRYSSGMM